MYQGRWFLLSKHSPWFRGKLVETIPKLRPGSDLEETGAYLIGGSPDRDLTKIGSVLGAYIDSADQTDWSPMEIQFFVADVSAWTGFLVPRGRKDICANLWTRVLANPRLQDSHKAAEFTLNALKNLWLRVPGNQSPLP
jgi:hypothetical protein